MELPAYYIMNKDDFSTACNGQKWVMPMDGSAGEMVDS